MTEFDVSSVDGGVVFGVKVVPGSSRTAITGLLGEKLKVKVASAAEKGKANKCLVDFLAAHLGVSKGAVRIIAGQSSAEKRLRVEGISAAELIEKLGL